MKHLLYFPFFYLKEVVVGSLLIVRDIFSPTQRLSPVLLRIPLTDLRPRQRLLLACLVSMTPGTISIGEEDDGSTFVVHSLYGGTDPTSVIAHLKRHYEPFVALIPI